MGSHKHYGFGRVERRRAYRDCESFAVLKMWPDEHGWQYGPALKVFGTQREAERYANELRASREWPEGVNFSVSGRWHDASGKITDRDYDLYVA